MAIEVDRKNDVLTALSPYPSIDHTPLVYYHHHIMVHNCPRISSTELTLMDDRPCHHEIIVG